MQESISRLGFCKARPYYYGLAAIIGILASAIAYVVFVYSGLLDENLKNTNIGNYRSWTFSAVNILLAALYETVFVTLGEEIFFRGFVGGWLFRRYSFYSGNLIQTAIFLLPHLILLFVAVKAWPILILISIGGWMVGFLRYKSGSIFPGVLAHTISNTFAAALVMHHAG